MSNLYKDFKIVEFDKDSKYTGKKGEDLVIVDDLDSVDDAGFILPKEIVVVDIDDLDRKACDEMLRIINTSTMYTVTKRGLHLYYTKPKGYKKPKGGKGVCPFGFAVEHKHNQITIKHEGVERPVENEGVFEELPYYFRTHEELPNLLGLGDGERYSKITQYNGRLTGKVLKGEIFQFINDYVFDEPMSAAHLKNANFEVRFDKNSEDDTSNPSRVAKYFIELLQPMLFEDSMYYKVDGSYTDDVDVVYRWMNMELEEMSSYLQDEVLKQIRRRCNFHKGYKEWKIRTPNGVLWKGDFIEIEGGYGEFTPYSLPFAYDPDATKSNAVEFLLDYITEGDEEYKRYIISIFSASLITSRYKRAKEPYFHFLVGDGGNFKGTLLKLAGITLGKGNVANNKLDALADEKKVLAMQNKLANIGEDILDKPINEIQMGFIKNITAADDITLRELYQSARNGRLVMCNLIFSSNHVLKSFEKGDSFKRRVRWVPMFNTNDSDVFNDDFFDELYSDESAKYFTKLIVEEYMSMYTKGYPSCKVVDEYTAQYHEDNNNVAMYVKEFTADMFIGNKPKDCYDNYCIWAEEEGLNVASKKQFQTVICQKFQLEEKIVCNKSTANKSRRQYVSRKE